MKIIGKGFHGIVLKKSDMIARKYHSDKQQWRDEVDNLSYLAKVKDLNINCTIPKIYDSGSKAHVIDGKSYSWWTDMELIPGKTAHELIINTDVGDPAKIGKSIGTVLFDMHTTPSLIAHDYNRALQKNTERFFRHMIDFKLAKICQIDKNPIRLSRVQEAVDYLLLHERVIARQRVLSHHDINMQNIIINNNQSVKGLVDWSSFGVAHPSITLYQLANTDIWQYIEMQYERLGGVMRKDFMYAATCIHVAWSTAYWFEINEKVDEESMIKLEKFYDLFQTHKILIKFRANNSKLERNHSL